MKNSVIVLMLLYGSCYGKIDVCPLNRMEKMEACSAMLQQFSRSLFQEKGTPAECLKAYLGIDCMVDIMRVCPVYETNDIDYRPFRTALYKTLHNICPPVGLEDRSSELERKTGGDCQSVRVKCIKHAGKANYEGDNQMMICRSIKPVVECAIFYAKKCYENEENVYKTEFASYARTYASSSREKYQEFDALPENSPRRIVCNRLKKNCDEIAKQATTKNCSILKESYECIDDYINQCKSRISEPDLRDYRFSRTDFFNHCSME